MCRLYNLDSAVDRQHVQELFTELVQFIHDNFFQRFGVEFDVPEFVPPSRPGTGRSRPRKIWVVANRLIIPAYARLKDVALGDISE